MIRKGRLLKNTAIALAIISVFGSSLSSVSAMELSRSAMSISQYVDGEYSLTEFTKLLKEGKNETSMANNYLKSSDLIVRNGQLYLKITFINGDILTNITPKIGNTEATIESKNYNETTKERSITFKISSLSDKIKLDCTMNIGAAINATCDLSIDTTNVNIPSTGEEEKNDAVTSPTPSVPNTPSAGVVSGDIDTNKGQTLKTTLLHETQDKESSAHSFLKSSKYIEENNKKYIVMVFDNSKGYLKELQGYVNGQGVKTINKFDESNKTLSMKFEIDSLENLTLSFTYNPYGDVIMTHMCRIQSELESTGGNNTGNGSDSNIENGSGSTGGSNTGSSTNKNGYYQLKNILHLDNPTGYAMVRNLLSETTNMEVKNGKTYITLRMSMASQMSNINIKVDGKNANFTKTNVGNDILEFKIEVPSTSSKLTFSMFVAAMGQNVDFKVSFDESTIKFISSNEEPTIPSTGTTTGGSTTGGLTSTDTDLKVESSAVKGKLYTIQNQIISSSSTGQQMARKYTSSTTKIEEIDGKMYATLTFTGVDLMSNHKIYVNGSVVSHSITSKTSSSVSLRFAIPNVNADIKVQAYIIPMGSTVTYGVKLLESTLKFVKDFEIENGTLPQTGSLINSEAVMATGGLLAMSGVLLRRKRK